MMARHKHADLIHAWAEGAEIEIKGGDGIWYEVSKPAWDIDYKYRLKPKEPEWYDNIPAHGVLCWWNRGITLITGKDGNSYIHNKSQYIRSETHEPIPLTNEEIERFKR